MKPIRTKYQDRIEYTINGIRHREDGPAVIYTDGSMYWYKNGKVHRENNPALIAENGGMIWYKDGMAYRSTFVVVFGRKT